MDSQASRVNPGSRGGKAHRERGGLRDLTAPQGNEDRMVTLGREDSQGRGVSLGSLGKPEHRAVQVCYIGFN